MSGNFPNGSFAERMEAGIRAIYADIPESARPETPAAVIQRAYVPTESWVGLVFPEMNAEQVKRHADALNRAIWPGHYDPRR